MKVTPTRRALILLATVLDLPGLAPAIRRVTAPPVSETIQLAGSAVAAVRPSGGRGPWPTYVFVNGAHPERRREPVVARLTEGLARAGFLVIVPDPPGLAEGAITPATLDVLGAIVRAAVEQPTVEGARVALLGASTGGSLALLAAADPGLRDRVSAVVAVTPFADLKKIVCLATTGSYRHDASSSSYLVNAALREGVVRSLLAAVADQHDRRRLHELPKTAEETTFQLWRRLLPDLEPPARAVARLLINEDANQFETLYGELPTDVRATIACLSPVSVAPGVSAPVELVVPPTDVYFPRGEALALARLLPAST